MANQVPRSGPGEGDDSMQPGSERGLEPGRVEAVPSTSPGSTGDLDLFPGLQAPQPVAADPGTPPRILAFSAILIGGLLGGLIGFGVGRLLWTGATSAAALGLVGAVTGAVGVGVLANLTLRAMGEWKAVQHPEADT